VVIEYCCFFRAILSVYHETFVSPVHFRISTVGRKISGEGIDFFIITYFPERTGSARLVLPLAWGDQYRVPLRKRKQAAVEPRVSDAQGVVHVR
jgi:hypothetical protein